jgi:hypothetical protein
MPPSDPEFWREALADALDAQGLAIEVALTELANVEAVLEHRGRMSLVDELRGFTAGLRAEASAIAGGARELRAADRAATEHRPGFPLALTAPATTRHPRAPGGHP